jgi:uncharacterized protein
MMIPRKAFHAVLKGLHQFPAVALLGPRQVGKTTLALEVARTFDPNHLYLDLESELDQAKLANARLFLSQQKDRLVVIDEVHRKPALFPELRGLIDEAKRQGRRAGQYLLLGSASLDLLKQAGETLAGRILYTELCPLQCQELQPDAIDKLWLRGGFPDSFLAPSDDTSLAWRRSFIRSYLERDVSQFAPRISTTDLRSLWVMLAHQQATQVNVAALSRSLGVDQRTVKHHISLLTDLMLLRQIPAWHGNVGKRLVKTPKTHIRDSGLLHSLLGIETTESLLSNPVVGGSWEAFVSESVAQCLGDRGRLFFYRTIAGAEIDLLAELPGGERWVIEVKRATAPKLTKGFHLACSDLQPKRKVIITPGQERWWLAEDIEVMGLRDLLDSLASVVGPPQ